MQTLWQDLRYGARMLLKKPGFSLTAVITRVAARRRRTAGLLESGAARDES